MFETIIIWFQSSNQLSVRLPLASMSKAFVMLDSSLALQLEVFGALGPTGLSVANHVARAYSLKHVLATWPHALEQTILTNTAMLSLVKVSGNVELRQIILQTQICLPVRLQAKGCLTCALRVNIFSLICYLCFFPCVLCYKIFYGMQL